jgi:metallo-beta-lactamase family protein
MAPGPSRFTVDQSELVRWLQTFRRAPEQVYLVHGEPPAQDALASHLHRRLGLKVHVPQHAEKVEVTL